MKLIKSVVDKFDYVEKGQVFYWDDELAGFGMYQLAGYQLPSRLLP